MEHMLAIEWDHCMNSIMKMKYECNSSFCANHSVSHGENVTTTTLVMLKLWCKTRPTLVQLT